MGNKFYRSVAKVVLTAIVLEILGYGFFHTFGWKLGIAGSYALEACNFILGIIVVIGAILLAVNELSR